MNILFVVPYVPSLIRVRPYNLIRYLTARGHRVTVMTLWTTAEEKEAAARLAQECHRVEAVALPRWRSYFNALSTVPTRTPLQAAYCWQPALVNQIARLIGHDNGRAPFDVAHVEHLRGARFGLAIKSRREQNVFPPIPIVWDSVDCISHLFRQAAARGRRIFDRLLTRYELSRTERYEGWLVSQFEHVLVTSHMDKSALEALVGRARPRQRPPAISVLQNGVDLDYFRPDAHTTRYPATLVVSGKMSYHANISMVLHLLQDIMPRVWEKDASVQVQVVGKDPPNAVRAFAQDPRVTVTGTVPEIRAYLQRATIAVAPLAYGAGIQNKILEAMACAAPVVTTPNAVADLQVSPGENILVAENPASFSEQILQLLHDPALRDRIGQAGRRYVEKNHRWDAIAAHLEGIYAQVQGASRRSKAGS